MALVTQVAVFGNKRAFEQLVGKYQSPLRRFFLNQTLGDSQLSDDLAQETFIKAYMHIRNFRGMSNFSTWLFRIAYNVYYDEKRSRRQTDDFDSAGVMRLSSTSGDAGLRIDLLQALSQLKEVERTCITLQLIDGLPIDKISDITGMPQNTVKSHLKRGKEKLTNYLRENGYDR